MIGEVTVKEGIGVTETLATAVLVQPNVAPVTVQDVFDEGETVNGFDDEPVFHVYVAAPFAINVAVLFAQMLGEFTVIDGNALTTTVAIVDPLHVELVPVTENAEVDPGDIIIELPMAPLLHVQVIAPVEVSVVD